MKYEIIRRQNLGLSITGPFSRNRRRSESTYTVLTIGIILSAAAFIAALFQ
jgi:hypothetical protein